MASLRLSTGEHVFFDDEDCDLVCRYVWSKMDGRRSGGNTFYACSGRGRVLMHRLILGALGELVDHVDGDGLNNRRSNLRFATDSQNGANRRKTPGCSSVYKGVSRSRSGRWVAYIRVSRKRKYLGTFKMEADAARAYDRAAVDAWGEFARLNFPQSGREGTHPY